MRKSQRLYDAELKILQELRWDCTQMTTFFHVLEVFLCQGVLFTTDRIVTGLLQSQYSLMSSTRYHLMSSPGTSSQGYKQVDGETLSNLEKYIDQNVRVCLNEFTFFNENQYTVACAIVSAARIQCSLAPIWPAEMEQMTGLQHHHFVNLEQRIFDLKNSQEDSPDPTRADTSP